MFPSYRDCQKCELYKFARTKGTPTAGDLNAPILLVGEANGLHEDEQGIPFVGESGQLLREALRDANVTDFAITNICRCRPPKNRTPNQIEVEACVDYTLNDIVLMPNLKLIVCVGNVALRAFTKKQGITKSSGEEQEITIKGKIYKLMPLIHPSYVLQNRNEEKRFFNHVSRIKGILANTARSDSDFGEYEVIKTIERWREYKQVLLTCRIFSYDLETTGLNPFMKDQYIKCIGFSPKLLEAKCLPLNIWKDAELSEILLDLKEIFENKTIGKIGQNITFDNLWMKAILGIDVKGTIWDTKIAEYLLVGKGSNNLKEMAWKYSKCLHPDTQILMGDLTWKSLRDVQVGDTLIGFDESPPGEKRKRKFRLTTVINKIYTKDVAWKLNTNEGFLIGGENHSVLTHRFNNSRSRDKAWRTIKQIGWRPTATYRLSLPLPIYTPISDPDLYWLGGLLDGEGHVAIQGGGVGFAQKEGIVLERAKEILKRYNFSFYQKNQNGTINIIILGGFQEHFRFLQLTRPIRLIEKLNLILANKSFDFKSYPSTIKSKEALIEQELIDISTTTKTFIANGFAVHNCGGYEQKLPDEPQNCDGEALWQYNNIDADLTRRIYDSHIKQFADHPSSLQLMKTLLVPVTEAFTRVEYNGIRVDKDKVVDAERAVNDYVDSLIEKIGNHPSVVSFEKENGQELNINSHKQLGEVLFKIEGLPVIKRTEKAKTPSTDQEVLEYFKNQGNALCHSLLEYSSYSQMKKTFIKALVNLTTSDSKIHTTFWLTETVTGRTSSREPAMQNIPKGEKDILHIRDAFIADPDFFLVEADMNQHELRVMAELSQDQALLKALTEDVHRATASAVLGKSPEQITPEERRSVGKTINFGLIYGLSAQGLSNQLKIPINQAELYIGRFFETYWRIPKFWEEVKNFVRRYGYYETLSGRIRYISKDFPSILTNEVINHPIQSLASDILLYGLVGVDRLFRGYKSFISLAVHDSLVMNIYKTEMDLIPEIKNIMCNYFKKFIPFESELKVDISIGSDWGHLKKEIEE